MIVMCAIEHVDMARDRVLTRCARQRWAFFSSFRVCVSAIKERERASENDRSIGDLMKIETDNDPSSGGSSMRRSDEKNKQTAIKTDSQSDSLLCRICATEKMVTLMCFYDDHQFNVRVKLEE